MKRYFALVLAAVLFTTPGALAQELVKMGDLPALSSGGLYVAMEKILHRARHQG